MHFFIEEIKVLKMDATVLICALFLWVFSLERVDILVCGNLKVSYVKLTF